MLCVGVSVIMSDCTGLSVCPDSKLVWEASAHALVSIVSDVRSFQEPLKYVHMWNRVFQTNENNQQITFRGVLCDG